MREEFEPCPNMFPYADGEILNDAKVIIHPSGSIGELEIFEPNTRVCLPGVLSDVGGRSEALWEQRFLDAATKGLWPQAVLAGAPIIWSAAMLRVRVLALLDGQAGARAACSRRHSMDVIIVSGVASIIDDAASITIQPKPFMHRWSVWSGRRVGLWCSCGFLLHARQQLR